MKKQLKISTEIFQNFEGKNLYYVTITNGTNTIAIKTTKATFEKTNLYIMKKPGQKTNHIEAII